MLLCFIIFINTNSLYFTVDFIIYVLCPRRFSLCTPDDVIYSYFQFLGDIEIALKVIKDNKDMRLNPIDRHYNALECEIEPMEQSEDEYQVCSTRRHYILMEVSPR